MNLAYDPATDTYIAYSDDGLTCVTAIPSPLYDHEISKVYTTVVHATHSPEPYFTKIEGCTFLETCHCNVFRTNVRSIDVKADVRRLWEGYCQ